MLIYIYIYIYIYDHIIQPSIAYNIVLFGCLQVVREDPPARRVAHLNTPKLQTLMLVLYTQVLCILWQGF